jgi:hypothetical protein
MTRQRLSSLSGIFFFLAERDSLRLIFLCVPLREAKNREFREKVYYEKIGKIVKFYLFFLMRKVKPADFIH